MDRLLISLMQTLPVADGAPEWVHLLPVGTFTGVDGRGPYEAGDLQAIINASLKPGRKLPIDINHSTDLLGPKGQPTPALGWIIAMEARADGVWGKVEWTGRGRAAVAGRAYGYLSPVIMASAKKPHKVASIARASLTNDPNLTLTSLHNAAGGTGETDMLEALRKALGLPETADEAAVLVAIEGASEVASAHASTLGNIAEAVGLAKTATGEEIVTALQARDDKAADVGEVVALKSTIKSLQTQVTTLTNNSARKAAETAVDAAVAAGKIVPALRDHFIARHVKDAAEVDAELKLLPSIHAGGLRQRPASDGASLTAEDQQICELMGIDPAEFAKTAKAMNKEFV